MKMDLVLDIIFSSDDEDFAHIINRRPQRMQRPPNHFEAVDDVDFQARFRLSKESTNTMLHAIEHDLQHVTEQNNAIPAMHQLLLVLRYYATGSFLIAMGDFSGVSKTSAHRIVHRVTCAIARLRPDVISFPQVDELRRAQMQFYHVTRFPRVVGCIDCTRVKIQSLGGDNAEYMRNRKGYFSVNIQAICNNNLEFTNIVERWPGSVHDSTIFDNSRIRAMLEARTFDDGLLLGDSGYPLRPYMVMPLLNPQSRAEQLYNESHIRTRNTIERMFGIWKRRFPIMALGLRCKKIQSMVPFIVATPLLHNNARRTGDPLPQIDPALHLPAPWDVLIAEGNVFPGNYVQANHQVRNALFHEYFESLH